MGEGRVVELVERMVTMNRWANAVLVEALPRGDEAMRKVMGHVIATERSYLNRLNDKPTVDGWPDWSHDDLLREADQVGADYATYLETLSDDGLGRRLQPTGRPMRTDVANVLMHVVTHSFHHRAVVCRMMRAAGIDPPRIGYMYFVATELEGA
jgi:uncharacterized damage-inducible protein DinB